LPGVPTHNNIKRVFKARQGGRYVSFIVASVLHKKISKVEKIYQPYKGRGYEIHALSNKC
jgi:hypothetical protein